MLQDIISNLKVEKALECKVYTADADGVSIDLQERLAAMASVNVGVSADTLSGSVYIELFLKESDDNSVFAAVADADISGTAVSGAQTGTFAKVDDAAEDDAIYKVGYKGKKRYLKVCINLVGTHTNGTPISAEVLSNPQHLPV